LDSRFQDTKGGVHAFKVEFLRFNYRPLQIPDGKSDCGDATDEISLIVGFVEDYYYFRGLDLSGRKMKRS
jgi:hypothetical protein